MKSNLLRLAFLATLFVVLCFPSLAQSNSQDAHLSGTLLDAAGGGAAGVRVSAKLDGVGNAQSWTATSAPDGSYALELPPGRYHVRFVHPSFVPRDFVLDFAANQQRKLDLKLALERLSSSVIVTAQAEPVELRQTSDSVTVISRDEIDARQSVSVPDALLYAPGITIGRTGSGGGTASVFINGGNSAFTKVLVDGAPINIPGGTIDFSNLTLDDIDKVEIVRGAESAIYGTDAVSGVIQLFTHQGTTRIPGVSVFGEGGNFSSGRGGARISGLFGGFDYSVTSSYLQTAGQGINNDFLNHTYSGNFGYAFSESNRVRLSIRDNNGDAGIPGQTLFEPPNFDSQDRFDQQITSASLAWDFSTGSHWKHEISSGESWTLQRNFAPTFGNSTFQYNRASINLQSTYLLSNFAATAGYQYEVENAGLPFLSVGHVRRNNQAGFLDFHYLPHPRLSLSFGARAEANENFGTRVVPRVGGAYMLRYGKAFWGGTRLRAFYGQGIKEPRFDQNFSDQFGDLGNPSLKPEASKNWSFGVEQKLANDRIKVTAEYFYTRFYDIINFINCSPLPAPATSSQCGTLVFPGMVFGYFLNTDRARARGINLAAETRVTHWLNAAGNYTYDDTRVLAAPELASDPVQSAGNRLLRRPLHSGSLTMNAVYRQFSLSLSGYFAGRRSDSDFFFPPLNLTSNPGYARFDLSTRYDISRSFSFYARASNLFDKSYQDALGYPALGRAVRVGMSYRIAGRN